MALHHASGGGQDGFVIWDEWSAQGDCYREGETTLKWNSFGSYDGPLITLGTLYHRAQEAGWKELDDLPKYIATCEEAISATASDPTAYLDDRYITAFAAVRRLSPTQYEILRTRLR